MATLSRGTCPNSLVRAETGRPPEHRGREADPMTSPTNPDSRCTAKNQPGTRCKNPVVLGTRVCRFHGGAAPQVRDAGLRRIAMADAKQAAEQLGLLIEITPEQALLDEVQRCAGMLVLPGACRGDRRHWGELAGVGPHEGEGSAVRTRGSSRLPGRSGCSCSTRSGTGW